MAKSPRVYILVNRFNNNVIKQHLSFVLALQSREFLEFIHASKLELQTGA